MFHHLNDLYIGTVKRVKDVQDVQGSAWAAFTSFPFLYSLSTKVVTTVRRRSPELIKSNAVWTWEKLAGGMELTVTTGKTVAVQGVRVTAYACQVTKNYIQELNPPRPLAPVKDRLIIPAFDIMEGAIQFALSDDIIELYQVARAKIVTLPFGTAILVPVLVAAETAFHILVVMPSRPMYYISREAVASGADQFIDISKTRYQSIVEHLYSATVVIDKIDSHLSKAQWNLLGWGRYSELAEDARRDIVNSMSQRWTGLDSALKQYEFLCYLRTQSAELYEDLMVFTPAIGDMMKDSSSLEIMSERESQLLKEFNASTIPCWFYSPEDTKLWEKFRPFEARRLERGWKQFSSTGQQSEVLVDEGRHIVDLALNLRRPVYWDSIFHEEVRRSTWLYMERNYELMPYSAHSEKVLEDAFLFLLKNIPAKNGTDPSDPFTRSSRKRPYMTVQVDDQEVEFYSLTEIVAVKRILAGTTFLYSRRRVFRGDPRPRNDKSEMDMWVAINNGDLDANVEEDDKDLHAPVDHLVLVIHGIGDALRTLDFNIVQLRSIVHCADSLRSMHQESMNSADFKVLPDELSGKRVEFLPVEWHTKLHSDTLGIDESIRQLTLRTIPKLREFGNDSLLDVLFYLSPSFHQLILDEVTDELNRLYRIYSANHPNFTGQVSFLGHSLGSVVCFDILANQRAERFQDLATGVSDSSDVATTPPPSAVTATDTAGAPEIVAEAASSLPVSAEASQAASVGVAPAVGPSTGRQLKFDAPDLIGEAAKKKEAKLQADTEAKNNAHTSIGLKGNGTLSPKPEGEDESKRLKGSKEETSRSPAPLPTTGQEDHTVLQRSDSRVYGENGSVASERSIEKAVTSAGSAWTVALLDTLPSGEDDEDEQGEELDEDEEVKEEEVCSEGINEVEENGDDIKSADVEDLAAYIASGPLRRESLDSQGFRRNSFHRDSFSRLTPRSAPSASDYGRKTFARPSLSRIRKHAASTSSIRQEDDETLIGPRLTYANTNYIQLDFKVENFFAMGSPLGMFLKVRGQRIDRDYSLPTCKRFFNIFHPYDPVAYRMEPIFAPENVDVEPAIIPTFHGKLRIHYQVKEAVKKLWVRFMSFKTMFETSIEEAVQKVGLIDDKVPRWEGIAASRRKTNQFRFGNLSGGHRVDFSLQENEVEVATEYLFAITAHVIYWTSKDVSLFMAKQILLGPIADSETPDPKNVMRIIEEAEEAEEPIIADDIGTLDTVSECTRCKEDKDSPNGDLTETEILKD